MSQTFETPDELDQIKDEYQAYIKGGDVAELLDQAKEITNDQETQVEEPAFEPIVNISSPKSVKVRDYCEYDKFAKPVLEAVEEMILNQKWPPIDIKPYQDYYIYSMEDLRYRSIRKKNCIDFHIDQETENRTETIIVSKRVGARVLEHLHQAGWQAKFICGSTFLDNPSTDIDYGYGKIRIYHPETPLPPTAKEIAHNAKNHIGAILAIAGTIICTGFLIFKLVTFIL